MRIHPLSALFGALIVPLLSMQGTVDAERSSGLTDEQAEILSHLSLVDLDDGQGGRCRTLRVSGVNLQVVNGSGSTEASNCVGNLIVGYNERGAESGLRTGSHNVVLGTRNDYSSHGGIVAGFDNATEGAYASITGGSGHVASAEGASITGGLHNRADGRFASVTGGDRNVASGYASAVVGGGNGDAHAGNEAAGDHCVIVGGNRNYADRRSVILAGASNTAIGFDSVIVSGGSGLVTGVGSLIVNGQDNMVSGLASTISGGRGRSVEGDFDWRAGDLLEDD